MDVATYPESIWQATAVATPLLPRLERDLQTDVAIIGGGFTGLAAARDLHRAGVGSVVLEANDIGWGASGRNGGIVVPRFKVGYAGLARAYGRDTAMHLQRLAHQAIDVIEETVSEFRLDCEFERCGHLTAAHSHKALAALQADADWLASTAGDRTPKIITAQEVAEGAGTSVYKGGYFDSRGGVVHPLSYCRGLAGGLAARGVPIYVGSPVRRILSEADGIVVEAQGGRVRARQVIIGTNAYSDIVPGFSALGRRIVPVASSVIATGPLSPNVSASVLPARWAISDTKHLMNWFRMAPGDRLIFGGRGDITGQRDDPSIYRGLEDGLVTTFPQTGAADIAFRWSGLVAVTLDNFPHLGRLNDRVLYALGYGGRGVAFANLLGRFLARMATGEQVDAGPLSNNRFAPVPFHRLRVPVMRLTAAYYGLRDRLDA